VYARLLISQAAPPLLRLHETFPDEFWNWYDCADGGAGEGDGAGFGGPPACAVAANPIMVTVDAIDIA
jgi:hypothetical protein